MITTFCKALVATVALGLGSTAALADQSAGPVDAYEVRFQSVQMLTGWSGRVIARDCDPSVQCDPITARIDENTVFVHKGNPLKASKVGRVKWQDGLLVIDQAGNAVKVEAY